MVHELVGIGVWVGMREGEQEWEPELHCSAPVTHSRDRNLARQEGKRRDKERGCSEDTTERK